MKEVIEIIMNRDGLTRESARAVVKDAMRVVLRHIQCGEMVAAEESFGEMLGLEPDYLLNILMGC